MSLSSPGKIDSLWLKNPPTVCVWPLVLLIARWRCTVDAPTVSTVYAVSPTAVDYNLLTFQDLFFFFGVGVMTWCSSTGTSSKQTRRCSTSLPTKDEHEDLPKSRSKSLLTPRSDKIFSAGKRTIKSTKPRDNLNNLAWGIQKEAQQGMGGQTMEIPDGKSLPASTTITFLENNRESAWRMMQLFILNHMAHSIWSCCCLGVLTLNCWRMGIEPYIPWAHC